MKNDIKKAALLMSSLSAEDERWILDELKQKQVSNVDNLTDELTSLKSINDGANLSSMAIHIKHSEQFETCLKTIQAVDGAHYKRVKEVLADEPEWIVSTLLSFHNWSWKKKFLNSISITKRYQLYKLQKDPTVDLSYKVRETLVEGLKLKVKQ